LENFSPEFGTRCPIKTETIVQRVIGHFLPVFAGEKRTTSTRGTAVVKDRRAS
jgi:hypothetical protein